MTRSAFRWGSAAGEARHVPTGLADDGQRGGHVDAVDAREVYAAHLEQLRAQIELGRIASPAALLAFGRLAVMNLQTLQLRFDLLVALGKLRAHEVERTQRLLERKQVSGPPIALQANPSVQRTATGRPLGPRAGQCHHPSRGPSAFPAGSAQLKRWASRSRLPDEPHSGD